MDQNRKTYLPLYFIKWDGIGMEYTLFAGHGHERIITIAKKKRNEYES